LPRAGAARPSALSGTVQEIPPRLAPLLQRALAADPAERFPSAEAFAAALRAAASQGSPTARLELPPVTGPEPASYRGLGWIAAALVLGAGGWVAWRMTRPAPAPLPSALPPSAPVASTPAVPAGSAAPQKPLPLAQATSAAAVPPAATLPAPPPAAAPVQPAPDAVPSSDEAFARNQAQAFAAAYAREDWTAMGAVLDELQRRRIEGRVFGRNEEIRQVMEADHRAGKIPYDLMQRLRAYLPPPPGPQGQGDRPGQPPGPDHR
ncbi:MAG TPA: hypothetical protein VFT46_02035, partial [Holophagaceae bacterium]|nr:hypothetical protein [Holophagaceae bacterium]